MISWIFIFLMAQSCFIYSDEPINLGSNREIFIDDFLIESLKGVEIRLEKPRDEGIVHKFDKPWEGPFCGYSTVIKDKDKFYLYYRGLPKAAFAAGWRAHSKAEIPLATLGAGWIQGRDSASN